jgi:sugar lactone lactonase YvrE
VGALIASVSAVSAASQTVYYVTNAAFNGVAQYLGDGGSAQAASISSSQGLAFDAAGNMYVADNYSYVIRKVDVNGVVTTFAGNGTQGFSGDGGLATAAQFRAPYGLTVDAAGNVYVVDQGAWRIRKIDTNGIITTVAGNGTQGPETDGVLATTTAINYPQALAFDSAGNMYIAQSGKVRMVSIQGFTSTFATFPNFTPNAIAIDSADNVYVSDANAAIYKITQAGAVSVFAGTPGSTGFAGDGGPATSAKLYRPTGLAFNGNGNLFIVDSYNYRVRIVSGGNIDTVAGNGTPGLGANGVPATSTSLYYVPTVAATGPGGNIYFHDSGRIRKLSTTNPAAPTNTMLALPGGVVGTSYSINLTATGTAPVTWNLSSGSLPPGIILTPLGTLVGRPTAAGTYTFSIDALNGAGANATQSYTVVMSAAPTANLFLSPSSLNFPSLGVTVASTPQTLLIANNGSASTQLTSITSSMTDYAFTTGGTCPALNATFAPGQWCVLTITFTPTASGSRVGQLSVNSNNVAMQYIMMYGTGQASALTPSVSFNPSSISAGGTSVMTITLNNPNPIAALAAGLGPGYSSGLVNSASPGMSTTCATNGSLAANAGAASFFASGLTVPANGSCVVQVNVTAAAAGTYGATVGAFSVLPTNLPGNPSAASGTLIVTSGAGPAFSVSPAALSFSSARIGQSLTQTLTITNAGNAAMNLTQPFIVTGDYSYTTTCGATLAAGLNCAVVITFAPTQSGARSGTLTITTNAPGSPHVVALSGTGSLGGPGVSLAVSPGTVTAGAPATLAITLSNTNASAITLTGANLSLPSGLTVGAAASAGCGISAAASGATISLSGGTIPANGSCTASIPLNTANAGNYTITLAANNISSSAGSNASAATTSLTVAGAQTPSLSTNVTVLSFGNQAVNTSSDPQRIVITSSGTAPLTISGLSVSGDFGFVSDCPLAPAALAVGASCNVDITFSPLSAANVLEILSIASNAGGSSLIALHGTGVVMPVPKISVTPLTINFGTQPVGHASAVQTVIVANAGQAALSLRGISLSGAGFNLSSTAPDGVTMPSCGATLAPQTSCFIAVVFAPGAIAPATGEIAISHNAPSPATSPVANPVRVALSGTGVPDTHPVIRVSGALNFGDQIVGTQSAAQTISITNAGTAALNVSGVTLSGATGDFILSGNCALILSPGATCSLTAAFSPIAVGTRAAQINIASNAQNATSVSIALSGNGVPVPAPVVRLSATAVGFGTLLMGGVDRQDVTLTNAGTAPLVIQGIDVNGDTDFNAASACGSGVSVQASCVLSLTFTPHGLGPRSATVMIRTNAADSPHRIELSGAGCRAYSQATSRIFLVTC